MNDLPGGRQLDYNDADAVSSLMRDAAEVLMTESGREGACVTLPGEGNLLITGDLHDHLDNWHRILHMASLEESPSNHLLLQELIHGDRLVNGLDFSWRMLARVASAVLAYPGQVHVMLGNHELAQLTRRPVSKGAGNSVVLFEDAVEWTFNERTDEVTASIDEFFRSLPLAIRTPAGLLCTHSLPDCSRMHGFDQSILERGLEPGDYEGITGSAWMLTWGRAHEDEQLEELAERWNVTTFCIGHQFVEEGISRLGHRLVAVNSDHVRGVAVPWKLEQSPSPESLIEAAVPLQTVPVPEAGAS